jgi:DNA-binding MarR family transcriptional regulator
MTYMDIDKLIEAGLNDQQAKAYALLIEAGGITPPEAAKKLQLTRSNAYKTLDRLVEMRLAERKDIDKKLTYLPTSPTVFADLSAQQRAEVTAREEAVSNIMQELLSKYYAHSNKPDAEVFSGRSEVARAYYKQLASREDVYFVHTPADLPMMGFDVLHEIRTNPARHGNKRYGILTAPTEGPINYDSHKRTNLEITWADKNHYNSPVEWSATKSSLLLITYATDPQAILITDPVVAGAFIQLWKMMDALLKPTKLHQTMQK